MIFALTLVEHRNLGFIFTPYLLKPEKGTEQYTTYDKLTQEKLGSYSEIITPEQAQLVKFTDNYSDTNLFKLFCKSKKLVSHQFIKQMGEELFVQHVRPYIEKQMFKCLELMELTPVPMYHKMVQNKIYESDKIKLINKDCSTIFNFIRVESGIKYHLSVDYAGKGISLTGSKGLIVVNEPCCLSLNDYLFVFKDIDGKKLLPFFEKEFISIPKQAEEKYFETFIQSAIAKYTVRPQGFAIEREKVAKKAIIELEKDLKGHFSLILKFVYNKNIYLANRFTTKKVHCHYSENEVRFTTHVRDYEWEEQLSTRLLSLGLVNQEGPYFYPHRMKGDNALTHGPITWLNTNKTFLQQIGVEIAKHKLDKDYYLGMVDLDIEVSDKDNDWFDIKATVVFDGFKLSFSEFGGHISAGIREFVLPNNKVLILPEEWFDNFSELLSFSKVEDGKLKLKKQHFALLNNRIGKVSDSFKDNIRNLLTASGSELVEVPNAIKAELRGYQKEGFSWMYRLYENNFGACLADDMGLGKTLQTISLLRKVKEEIHPVAVQQETSNENMQLSLFGTPATAHTTNTVQASLIVVPTSLIHNWLNEIRKFAPDIKAVPYSGAKRGEIADLIKESDVIVTSYGLVRNDLNKLMNQEFLYLILDESQVIKNPGSKTYAAMVSLKARHKIVLSGTPIENSLSDLWAQFNFINPGLLGSLSFFQSAFQVPIEKHNDAQKKERLQQLIAPFLLRRTKQEVAKELPELSEQIVQCSMNESQAAFYEKEKSKARNFILARISEGGLRKNSMMILKSLMRLRQIANHPVLAEEDYIAGSGKFEEIKRSLENLNAEGHKALIFSSFVGHLNLVAQWFDSQNIGYVILTGETRSREEVVKEFQENESCKFFLISLKAGGVGLNLTAASYVLMLDPWWNPAAEKQAINRAHRIGQDKHVMVYRYITEETLEEKIIRLQDKKAELADLFINENAFKDISEEELLALLD